MAYYFLVNLSWHLFAATKSMAGSSPLPLSGSGGKTYIYWKGYLLISQ
jgi:hypothetical protein